MARGRLEYRFDDWSVGYRSRPSSTNPSSTSVTGQSKKELLLVRNMTYDPVTGTARRRNGHVSKLNGAFAIDSMVPARGLPAGAASQLVFKSGASVFAYTVAGGAGAAILAGLTTPSIMTGTFGPQSGGQGPLWLMNGFEARYWTGAVAGNWTAATGTLPLGYYVVSANNRIWSARFNAYAGLSDPKSGLGWSEIGDPRNWPAANITMFDPSDGQPITGIGRLGSYLLVFKPNKTWLVYDLDTGANRLLSGEIGCPAHRTIVETQRGTYFLTADRGLAVTDGSTIKLVEDKPGFKSALDTRPAGNAPLQSATFFNDRYYLTIARASGINGQDLYEYDPANDAWWQHSTPFGAICIWDGDGPLEMWGTGVGAQNSRVTKPFGAQGSDQTDFTGDFTPQFQLPWADFKTDRRKVVKYAVIEGHGNSMRCDFFGEEGGGFALIDAAPTDPVFRGIRVPRPSVLPPSIRVSIGIQGLDAGQVEPFEMRAVSIHADLRGR